MQGAVTKSEKNTNYLRIRNMAKDIRDSSQHMVAHELLEHELVDLKNTITRSLSEQSSAIKSIAVPVTKLQLDIAVISEKLKHSATNDDISSAIARCQSKHPQSYHPPNYKAIGAMIAAVIAAVGAAIASAAGAFN